MQPVADTDLNRHLANTFWTPDTLAILQSFIGCLCSTLAYLHQNKCRHKDLKPQNILIKGDTVLIADFGTALDWTESHSDITTGPPEAFTKLYVAPEVGRHQPRDTSSDIWSLGCVFLEIATILSGKSLQSKADFFGSLDSPSAAYWLNHEAIRRWLTSLRDVSDHPDAPIYEWVESMTAIDANNRPTAEDLVIQISTSQTTGTRYGGTCCFDDFGSDDTSWEGSVPEDDIFETANTVSDVTTMSGGIAGLLPLSPNSPSQKQLGNAALESNLPDQSNPAIVQSTMHKPASPTSFVPSPAASGSQEIERARSVSTPQRPDIKSSRTMSLAFTLGRSREQPQAAQTSSKGFADEVPTSSITPRSRGNADNGHFEACTKVEEAFLESPQRFESCLLCLRGQDSTWQTQLSRLIETPICDSKGSNVLMVACKLNNTALAKELVYLAVTKNSELIKMRNTYGNSALHFAAFKGRPETIKILMENGAQFSAQNVCGMTALSIALYHRKDAAFQLLFEYLPPDSAKVVDKFGYTILHRACSNEISFDIIQRLIDAGADPLAQDLWGEIPIQFANPEGKLRSIMIQMYQNLADVVNRPLRSFREMASQCEEQSIHDCPCDVCIVVLAVRDALNDPEGKFVKCVCPTHVRTLANDTMIKETGLRFFLEICLCRTCVDTREHDATNTPCSNMARSYELVCNEELSSRRMLVPPFTEPPTPLSGAGFAGKPLPPYPGHQYYDRLIEVKLLSDTSSQSQQDLTALALSTLADAGFKGSKSYRKDPDRAMRWVIRNYDKVSHRVKIVEILLDCGANVDVIDEYDGFWCSPLDPAALSSDLPLMQLLLKRNASVDIPTTWTMKTRTTPLRKAIYNGNTLAARKLLQAGANINDQSAVGGHTILHDAVLRYDLTGWHIPLLLAHGASTELRDPDGNTPLHVAISKKNLYAAIALLEGGADVEAIGNNSTTPLGMALDVGSTSIASRLLEFGANVHKPCGSSFCTLIEAIKKGHVDIARLLVEEYAADEDIPRTNELGENVLHVVGRTLIHDEKLIDLLLGFGLDVNAEDKSGSTPLHYAARVGNILVVKKLLDLGATIHLQNHAGKTPLDLAQSRHPQVVKCLGGTFKKTWWRR
ncbi:ankyrin repeat-containing domain protein [Lophiotrema nucula]|uniref:Ankyrin repeat-containing domain protein n=1 Tax=Lophiotrema nucula TaxID=690887 RepID=A0A6A5ZG53_9PLEO|nr:ankyrin repeat-containing domain protein [Lophiotrema nucula]